MTAKKVVITREKVLQTFSHMNQNIKKKEKLKDQIPQSRTSTSPYYGLA